MLNVGARVFADWRITPGRWGPRRRPVENILPFDDIIDLIVAGAEECRYRSQRGCLEAKGHTRAEFVFAVPAHTYDLFFNSASGYRAQFYIDHRLGVQQNRKLIDRLAPMLLATVDATPSNTWSQERVRTSLLARSAKIWINEEASTLDQKSIEIDSLLTIAVPHWIRAAYDAAEALKGGVQPKPNTKQKAILGIQAPEGVELKVLGGWLHDVHGRELIVPSKRNRARQIRAYGFA
jgi:hypothetical protein